MSDRFVGPCQINCDEKCDVPAGVTLADVPIPRHNWGDVAVCPNGCDRAFLIVEASEAGERP